MVADPSSPAGERQLGYLTETRLGWPVRGLACLERQPRVVFRSTCPDDRSCAVALVRSVEVDDVVLAATRVWTAAFDTPAEAQRRRDWLDADAVRRIHLGRYAALFGPGYLTSAVEVGLRIEEVRLEERRRLDDEAALLAREMAEEDLRRSRKIACYFRERRKRFFIDLERGNGKEPFWSIAFDEKWERDRFWDYFGWQRDRWPSFAEHLDGHDSRDLEHLLVKEMFDRLAPDRLPAQLALDWVPEVQEAVIASCLRQAVAGEPWFSMPPAALDGVPGAGRRMVARRIARCAGLPFVGIDVAGPAGASRLRRVCSPPDVLQPSPVVLAMALSRCANPLVLIEGVDDAGQDALGMVKAMVDPVSGRRWSEDALEAVVDLGHVNWLVQSSAVLGPPRSLSFLRRLTVPADSEFDHELNRLTLLSELVDDLGLDARDVDGAALLAALPADSKRTNAELRLEAEKELVMMLRPYG